MGLDDFMDMDTSESSGSSSTSKTRKSKSKESKSLDERSSAFRKENGEVKRNGPVGFESFNNIEDTIEGHISVHEYSTKYYLPIFPIIEQDHKFNRGSRYRLESPGQIVTCLTEYETQLARINRELVMLDTGTTNKEEALDILEERFGYEVDKATEVVLYLFGSTYHMVNVAQAMMAHRDGKHWTPSDALLAAHNKSHASAQTEDIINSILPW